MKPGWEFASGRAFFSAEMGKYPYAVVRAQRALSPGNFYTAIRGMRPGPAFAQHAP